MKIFKTIILCIICTTFYGQSFNFSKIAEFERIEPVIYIDFDGDGIKDIIAYKYDHTRKSIVIYQGNDDASDFQNRFNVISEIDVPFSYDSHMQVGDFDGDGDLDLIDFKRVLNNAPFDDEFRLYMIKNNDFILEIVEMGFLNTRTIEIWSGDYNNDGKTDLFSSFGASVYLDSLSVIEFEADSIKSNTTIMSFDYYNLEVVDINKDGKVEIFGYDNDNDRLDIIFLDSLDFSNVLSIQELDPDFRVKYSDHLVDLDRNGVIDLVYEVDEYVYCIYNIESAGHQVPTVIDTYELDSYIDVVFFDFDGDGKTELLVENGSQHFIYNNLGDSIQKKQIEYSKFLRGSKNFHLETDSITGKQLYLSDDHNNIFLTEITINDDSSVDYEVNTLVNSFWHSEFFEVKMTDVNLDGYDDVLYFANGSGLEISVMYGNEDGSFRKREIVVDEVKFPRTSKFVDFNNDGAIDIVYVSLRSGEMVILQNEEGAFLEKYKFDNSGIHYIFDISDFNDDGFQDIVLQKITSGNYELVGLENKSGNGFDLIEFEDGMVEYFNLVADLDHDGNKEFIDYDEDEDEVHIYQVEGGSIQKHTQSRGGSWRDMYQFNLDGLGNSEVVFWDYNSDDESYRINIYEYDSEQVKLNFQCKSEDLFGRKPDKFLFFDYNDDGYEDVVAVTNYYYNSAQSRIATLFEYNGFTLEYKGELGDNIDYNTNIILKDFILIDNKNGKNRYLVIDERKVYILNGEVRTDVTLCTYLDENENEVKEDDEPIVASSEILLTKDNTTFSYSTRNSGCTVANLPEAKYSIDLNIIDCLSHSIEDSIYIEVDTTYQFPLTINNDQDSVLVDITRAHSRCSFFARYWIQIYNLSCNDFSGTLNVHIDENSQSVEPLIGGELIGSHTLNYKIEDLPIGGNLNYEATVQMPSSDFLDFHLQDSYDLSNDNEDIIAADDSPYVLRCAYDPNDKSIQPDRTMEYGDQYILNEELEYLIRFENVGNDSAINIKVIDTISRNLDLSTLKIVSSSHDYRYTLNSSSRVLTVYFDDIYLPDNKTNEPEAHGFFKFKIMPIVGLDEFTSIRNDAQIYFDFNSPILTNVVSSIFVSDLSILKSVDLELDRTISVFPNPTNDIIYFIDENRQNINFSGCIYSSLGQVLMGFNNVDSVTLSSFEPGIYFIKITEYGVVKVIKTD